MKLGILIPFRANLYPDAVAAWMAMIGNIAVTPGVETKLYYLTRSHVQVARKELLEQAMADRMDWMLWLDDDAVPSPDVFQRLWASAGKAQVVIPWFTTKAGTSVTYDFAWDESGKVRSLYIPGGRENRLERVEGGRYVGGSGFHCVLMSRIAAMVVNEVSGGLPFNVDMHPDRHTAEDVWFYQHLFIGGLKVWQDCSIHVGHIGTKIV